MNRTAAPENTRRLRGPNGYQERKEPHRRTEVSTSTARKLGSENTTVRTFVVLGVWDSPYSCYEQVELARRRLKRFYGRSTISPKHQLQF